MRGFGEEKNGKIETRFFGGEAGVCQIALPLLELQIRLDDVGMGYLAARLELHG